MWPYPKSGEASKQDHTREKSHHLRKQVSHICQYSHVTSGKWDMFMWIFSSRKENFSLAKKANKKLNKRDDAVHLGTVIGPNSHDPNVDKAVSDII